MEQDVKTSKRGNVIRIDDGRISRQPETESAKDF
jgi:hypothetical protein